MRPPPPSALPLPAYPPPPHPHLAARCSRLPVRPRPRVWALCPVDCIVCVPRHQTQGTASLVPTHTARVHVRRTEPSLLYQSYTRQNSQKYEFKYYSWRETCGLNLKCSPLVKAGDAGAGGGHEGRRRHRFVDLVKDQERS
eukprot:2282541-Rhodomonas_salina.3